MGNNRIENQGSSAVSCDEMLEDVIFFSRQPAPSCWAGASHIYMLIIPLFAVFFITERAQRCQQKSTKTPVAGGEIPDITFHRQKRMRRAALLLYDGRVVLYKVAMSRGYQNNTMTNWLHGERIRKKSLNACDFFPATPETQFESGLVLTSCMKTW